MPVQEFTEEKQSKFRVSIATAAGVTPPDVTLDKIETISSRRGFDRHLLTDSLRVDTIVKASGESAAVSMASALTQDKINSELQKAGLPKVTMLEAPKAATVEPTLNVETVQDNQQKTSNNSTTIAAVVSTVVVVTVLLAGALFWRRRTLTKLQGSNPYKLSSATAAAAAAANDSEHSDSTHVMDICEHNRLKSTCQLCDAGVFGLTGAFGREDPLSEPLPASFLSNTCQPEEEPDESVCVVQEQVDFDSVFMDIQPSSGVSKRDTKNSRVKITVVDIDRGMTPTNVDDRGEMKSTKVHESVCVVQEQVDFDSVFMDILPSSGVSKRDTKNSPVKITVVDIDGGMTPTNVDDHGEMKSTKVQNLVQTFETFETAVSGVRLPRLKSLNSGTVSPSRLNSGADSPFELGYRLPVSGVRLPRLKSLKSGVVSLECRLP
jgi:hypothetical protein